MRGPTFTLLAVLALASGGCSSPPLKCVDATAKAEQILGRGKGVGPSDLIAAQAVKSEEFENVYLVAVKFNSGGAERTAVFASGGLDPDGMIFAIDNAAQAITDWGAPGDGLRINTTTRGVDDARTCVQ